MREMQFKVNVRFFDIISQSQKGYGKKMEPVCQKWKLTRNELDILLFLYNNPEYDRATDIVSHRGIAKSHVSISVASLENKGLLLRCCDPSDRRTVHLKLTDSGNIIAKEGRNVQQEFISQLCAGITEEEFILWEKITQKVCENIEILDKTSN